MAYQKLSKSNPGDCVRLRWLENSTDEFLNYLNSKAIYLGIVINVTGYDSFDKSMIVSYKNHENEVLSKLVCSKLLVEKD